MGTAWRRLTAVFWQTHRIPVEAVRGLADPALAWCSRKGLNTGQDFAIVEEAAVFVTELAKLTCPTAEPSVYSNKADAQIQWAREAKFLGAALEVKDRLRNLTARAGDAWRPSGRLAWDPPKSVLADVEPRREADHSGTVALKADQQGQGDSPAGVTPIIGANGGSRPAGEPESPPAVLASGAGNAEACDQKRRNENHTKVNTRWQDWGLGIEHGCGAWHLFHRVAGDWRTHHKVTIASGYQEKLLKAFLDGGGSLTKQDAIKLWNRHPAPTEVAGFLQRVKTELAVIRKRIRAEVGVSGKTVNPVWFDEHQRRVGDLPYRLAWPLRRTETIAAEKAVFASKTKEQLSSEELIDCKEGFESNLVSNRQECDFLGQNSVFF